MKKLIIALIIALACAGCDDSESKPKISCPDCKIIQKETRDPTTNKPQKKNYVRNPNGKITEPKG